MQGRKFFWPTNPTSSFCLLPSYFCLQRRAEKRQKAKGKRQKLFVFCSIDEYPSQLDAGEKLFSGPPTQLLHSAFCLLTFAFREVEKSTSQEVKKPRGRPPILEFLASWLLDFFPPVPIVL
jgi:hypothetical protein